jgi:endoglucanase
MQMAGLSLRSVPYALALVAIFAPTTSQPSKGDRDAFAYNRILGRGVNLGNALDAPTEGAWGVTLKANYFETIKDAGFNSVRIPIRWSAHAFQDPPYTIDRSFFERVDWAINQALSRHLAVVLDVHHYDEMNTEPTKQAPRLRALWKQIAYRYRNQPLTVFFELLNEPTDQLTDERWQEVFPDLLKEIREDNPNRLIIVGPASWNRPEHLPALSLPQDDRRLIATFHYYEPLSFTHQGASWVANSEGWRGTKWGTDQEREAIHRQFEAVASWARSNDRPIYLGEFGAIDQADMASRVAWTRAIAREAEAHGFSWSYWEFCSQFGAFSASANAWRRPLLAALLDK